MRGRHQAWSRLQKGSANGHVGEILCRAPVGLEKAILSILELSSPADSVGETQLLRLKGVNPSNVQVIRQVLRGKAIESVVQDIPVVVSETKR